MERYREVAHVPSGKPRPSWPSFCEGGALHPTLATSMNVFELTRALIDIDSVTPNEEQVGVFLADHLSQAGRPHRRSRRAN